jgi:epsilon-lactone hydrolase
MNTSSSEAKRIRASMVKDTGSNDVPIEVQRREWEDAAAQAVLPAETSVEVQIIDGIHGEMVRAKGVAQKPVMLWLHGGGFSTGSCVTHRDFAARLSQAIRMPVLLVDYRLAPENPFPAGLDDCVTVYRWLIAHGYDSRDVWLGGDSAGGGLALSTILALKEAGDALPAGVVLMSAWLDLQMRGESIRTHDALDPMVSEAGLRAAARDYVGEHDPREVLLSPVDSDLRGLPPTLIQVGAHEVLLSDSVRLAESAREVGAQVELEIWPEMWHFFQAWAGELPEGQAALEQVGRFVGKRN